MRGPGDTRFEQPRVLVGSMKSGCQKAVGTASCAWLCRGGPGTWRVPTLIAFIQRSASKKPTFIQRSLGIVPALPEPLSLLRTQGLRSSDGALGRFCGTSSSTPPADRFPMLTSAVFNGIVDHGSGAHLHSVCNEGPCLFFSRWNEWGNHIA